MAIAVKFMALGPRPTAMEAVADASIPMAVHPRPSFPAFFAPPPVPLATTATRTETPLPAWTGPLARTR